MICPSCHGVGLKRANDPHWDNAVLNTPCPECGGCDQPSVRDLEIEKEAK